MNNTTNSSSSPDPFDFLDIDQNQNNINNVNPSNNILTSSISSNSSDKPANKKSNSKNLILFVFFAFLFLIVIGTISTIVFLYLFNKPVHKSQEIDESTPIGELELFVKSSLKSLSEVDFEKILSKNSVSEVMEELSSISLNSTVLSMLSTTNLLTETDYVAIEIPFKLKFSTDRENVNTEGKLKILSDSSELTKSEKDRLNKIRKEIQPIYEKLTTYRFSEQDLLDLKDLLLDNFELFFFDKSKNAIQVVFNFRNNLADGSEVEINIDLGLYYYNGVATVAFNDLKIMAYGYQNATTLNDLKNAGFDKFKIDFKNVITKEFISSFLDQFIYSMSFILNNNLNSSTSLDLFENMEFEFDNIFRDVTPEFKSDFGRFLNQSFKSLSTHLDDISIFFDKKFFKPTLSDIYVNQSFICESGKLNLVDILFNVLPKYIMDISETPKKELDLQNLIKAINDFIKIRNEFEKRNVNFEVVMCTNNSKNKLTGMEFSLSFLDDKEDHVDGGFGIYFIDTKFDIDIPTTSNDYTNQLLNLLDPLFNSYLNNFDPNIYNQDMYFYDQFELPEIDLF